MLSNVKITPVERSFEDLFGHVIGFPRRRETSFDKGVERDLDTVRIETAMKLVQRGDMAIEEVADLCNLPVRMVQRIAGNPSATSSWLLF